MIHPNLDSWIYILTNGLTMQFLDKVYGIDEHILVDTAASH